MSTTTHQRRGAVRVVVATAALVGGLLVQPVVASAVSTLTLPANATETQVHLHWQTSTVLPHAGRQPAEASDEVPSDWNAGNPPASFDASAAPTTVSGTAPEVASTSVRTRQAGFDGISELQQKLSDGGRNLPGYGGADPSVCVGGGFVLETVQNAVRVYSTRGAALTPVVAIGEFFGDGPEEISTDPLTRGAFTHAHERCLYEAATHRFFVTSQRYATDGSAALELAVSRTQDPRGRWDIWSVPVSGDGTDGSSAVPGCPCSPGLLSLGADRHGIYLATTLFGFSGTSSAFRIFAISKGSLVRRTASEAMAITESRPADPAAEYPVGPAPAQSPPGATNADAHGGVEYFVAGCGPIRGAIFVLALSNTSSLDAAHPTLSLVQTRVVTEPTVGEASAVTQREGRRPLADYVKSQWGPAPLEFPTDFERCAAVVWADGRLWVTQATEVRTGRGPATVGTAWFQLVPTIVAGNLRVGVLKQGYVAVDGNNVIDSSVAVDRTGHGAIAFELLGPRYYPSAAYVRIDENGIGPVTVVGRGQVPLDSFGGYEWFGSTDRTANADDFSSASVGSDGRIWTAVSYQPRIARQLLVSWGSRITAIDAASGVALRAHQQREAPGGTMASRYIGPTIPFFATYANPAGPASAYPLRFVGTNPALGATTTTVPTELLPVRLTMPDGSIWDATSDAIGAAHSPLFRPANFAEGRGQFGDALMRTQFWNSGGQQSDYHVLLGQPRILPTVDITVPSDAGYVATNSSGTRSAVVDDRWFVRTIHNLINNRGISPRTLPIVLTHDARTTAGRGAHGWWSTRDGGRQTWISAAWFDGRSPLPDAAVLSHEVAEWFDDPFTDNVVPVWQSPLPGPAANYGCQRLLETGDPLVGQNAVVAGYHLQDEAMLPWFTRQSPSQALSGAYTLFGTFGSVAPTC